MNSTVTGRTPFEVDNREQFRQRLIASQLASKQRRRYITDIRWDDDRPGLWTILGWILFFAVGIVGIAKWLPAILEAVR